MQKIFISYAHEDETFVDRIVNDIEEYTNLNVIIDKRCLRPGDSLLKLFGEIGDSDYLIPVLSMSSIESKWCKKELRIAIIRSIQKENFKMIPITTPKTNWEALNQKMSNELKTALTDIFVGRFDKDDYSIAFQHLLESLKPEKNPESIYSHVVGPEGKNPFRRVRAEHFMDPRTFAQLFAEPEKDYGTLISPKPTLIEGCRGSGKTMILKSLEASIAPLIRRCSSFKDANCSYFGIYLRATRDTFAVISDDLDLKKGAIKGIFYDELILRLAQSLVVELCYCIKNSLIVIKSEEERKLCEEISASLRLEVKAQNLSALKRELSETVSIIIDYIRAKARGENANYSVKSLTKDNLAILCEKVKNCIPELENCCIYFLIDEYENLRNFQKTVLKTLVKWHEARTYSFKIAHKSTAFSESGTLEEQELEEGPDYSIIDLNFDIRNDRARFVRYIKDICRKILVGERFKEENIADVLQSKTGEYEEVKDDDLGKEEILNEVKRMLSLRGKDWSNLTQEEQNQAKSHFSVAAEYRLLANKRRCLAGFDVFISLSSGIVRNFLELCGMAYYFAQQDGQKIKEGEKILLEHQTEAAYNLSTYYLWVIRKNIEYLGPTLHRFIVDVGDILRQKLLKHLTEPESIILSIRNPDLLEQLKVKVGDEKARAQ